MKKVIWWLKQGSFELVMEAKVPFQNEKLSFIFFTDSMPAVCLHALFYSVPKSKLAHVLFILLIKK